MAQRNAGEVKDSEPPQVSINGERIWLRAEYHTHLFHYRMPETVAVAAVSPLVPSPLTVKMAMIAALARNGDMENAQKLVTYLPYLKELYIIPPEGAVTFKAFMRYVRPPVPPGKEEDIGKRDSNTGGVYGVSPHFREYTLWQGDLGVAIDCPVEAQDVVERALWDVTYLGAKDSQVTCMDVKTLPEKPDLTAAIREVRDGSDLVDVTGPIFRLADFAPDRAPLLENLIPFNRRTGGKPGNDYTLGFYMLPGTLHSSGRAKIYRRRKE